MTRAVVSCRCFCRGGGGKEDATHCETERGDAERGGPFGQGAAALGSRVHLITESANVSPKVVDVVLQCPQVCVDIRSTGARSVSGSCKKGAGVHDGDVESVIKVAKLTPVTLKQ